MIRKELQDIKDREEGRTDIRIFVAIQVLKGNKTEEEMKDVLSELEGLDLNASTRRRIHLYLNRNAN